MRPPPPPSAPADDPARLLRGQDPAVADLMKAYARRTRPGEHQSVAAWYRLRPQLDAGAPHAGVTARRWRPTGTTARLLNGALAAALIVLVAVASGLARRAPGDARPFSPPATARDARRGVGPGGAAGWGELGAGGAEGSSGARALGETATDDAPAAPSPRAG